MDPHACSPHNFSWYEYWPDLRVREVNEKYVAMNSNIEDLPSKHKGRALQ
jgi:hypothetical protein